jgi:hypothetical protein
LHLFLGCAIEVLVSNRFQTLAVQRDRSSFVDSAVTLIAVKKTAVFAGSNEAVCNGTYFSKERLAHG